MPVADLDPVETNEWREALDSVIEFEGLERAQFLVNELLTHANSSGVAASQGLNTPYINTIPFDQEEPMPDDGRCLEKLTNAMRWNAIAMVMRAGKVDSALGGHIASYASSAYLYEVGFQHFFRGRSAHQKEDCIYIQGHSSPGIYARAFLEGRLSEDQLKAFRQEIFTQGLTSYPHPWLMPDFWQFPTVSMGLGPLMGIYHARFLKYLQNRGLEPANDRKIWVFCGDGEMGEPESLGALNIAGREKLDNLIFVINCNLQRLDGPVWGNGQIIQEYESVFRGAGWNVIKSIWGSGWDELLAKDTSGLLRQRMNELIDGEYQNYSAKDGAFLRANFFGKYPELLTLVESYSDQELKTRLLDAGHDPKKVYAAYAKAVQHKDQPTVLLIKTVKGFGMGAQGEGLNVTHQTKKMDHENLKLFCQRFNLPLSDSQIENFELYKPEKNSEEMQYLSARRKALSGFLPARFTDCEKLKIPALAEFQSQLEDSGDREFSSTMAFVRILGILLKDEHTKNAVVPIVADESRTFGMEGLFRQIGIYSSSGQQYQPEDKKQLMYYREDQKGQLLQEGISEAGAMASWIAAATSYSTNQLPMIPFYIYYSMFGYQRFGDLVWAAGDAQARGFILGGTAGRTTLAGEGLQHQDGHNLLMFSVVPNCITYDPTFAYELAVIIQHGLKRMIHDQENVFYYITLMNENYHHPAMPENSQENIIKGLYLFRQSSNPQAQLLGSGAILREVIKAAELLEKEFSISTNIWSVTSFNELRKNSESCARSRRLHPGKSIEKSHVAQCLEGQVGPVIAATDYIKLYAEQIRSDIQKPYYTLGTDGFGRSDTRTALRDFFEVNATMIAYTTLCALAEQGEFSVENLVKAKKTLGIDADRPNPVTV